MLSALLYHAAFGGDGDHQLLPVGQQPDAVDGYLLQGPASAFLLDRGADHLLDRTMLHLFERG